MASNPEYWLRRSTLALHDNSKEFVEEYRPCSCPECNEGGHWVILGFKGDKAKLLQKVTRKDGNAEDYETWQAMEANSPC